ncbi:MAG: glycosyltransferase [Sumerlaeia bacterium]
METLTEPETNSTPASDEIARAPRVAFYLPSLAGGGAERTILKLAARFSEIGIPTDLVLAKVKGAYTGDVPEAIRVLEIGSTSVKQRLPWLMKYLRRERPHAMITALDHGNVAGIAKKLSLSRTRVIYTIRNQLSLELGPNRVAKEQARSFHIAKRFFRWADAVVGVSDGVCDDFADFADFPRHRIQTIYNPIVTPLLLEQAEAGVPDHPFFHREDRQPIIVGAGRLSSQKNFPCLMKAFAKMRREMPSRLLILGKGELLEKLESLGKDLGLGPDDFDLPGFQANPYRYFRHADLFVLSSNFEGLPGALSEALACGCPVVSTDCPSGPREILEDGRWGELVPVDDPDALAAAMLRTLRNPPKREICRARGMAFSQDRSVANYLKIIGLGQFAPENSPS